MDIEELTPDIIEILSNADLSQLSTKKIRLQLEEKYKVDLTDKKSLIDGIVMKEIAELEKRKEAEKEKVKRSNGQSSKKRKREASSDEDEADDNDNDDKQDKNTEDDEDIARQLQEEEENGAVRRTRHAHKKRAVNTKAEKKPRKKGAPRENRFTETCNLSPDLAAIVGEDKMKRSEVVKKMWSIVKEKNLFDPKDKRFMICDEQMMSVFGKKKVLLFGMMKYLSSHIYKNDEVVCS